MPARDSRAAQARREIGVTTVSPAVARLVVGAFAVTVIAVPLFDALAGESAWLGTLGAGLRTAAAEAVAGRPRVANLELQRSIDSAETRLEEDSRLRAALLAPTTWALAELAGVGNEQAYVGRDGWLFFREDVDHVAGRGFLEPRVLERRRLGGEPWAAPPQPDPEIEIVAFHAALERRGIELLVLVTPLKPTLHPERFTGRLAAGSLPENPSTAELERRLRDAGVNVVDVVPRLAAAAAEAPQYLSADTHWTPAAATLVARQLAGEVRRLFPEDTPPIAYRRQRVPVEGRGDIAAMLPLPAGRQLSPPERVETWRVLTPAGRAWRPDPQAEILLLGDSFTNIYSDPALGWGAGAGLAEQLAFELGRPLDRIAINAGGAWSTRAALLRPAADGGSRLEGKKLVIWQFAARELSSGDWRPIELP